MKSLKVKCCCFSQFLSPTQKQTVKVTSENPLGLSVVVSAETGGIGSGFIRPEGAEWPLPLWIFCWPILAGVDGGDVQPSLPTEIKNRRIVMIYHADKDQVSYGEAIGILLLDTRIPFPPGDVGNATTYTFPVRYEVVEGASIERLINKQDASLLEPFIKAGWGLVKGGVKAITGDCGFMVLFQEQLSREFPVPVFMSSLLQIPFILKILGPGKKVGIITADSRNLTEKHLQAAGVEDEMATKVAGMQDQEHFYDAILAEKGQLDFEAVQREVIQVGRELTSQDDNIGAILLECSDLPPYAAALQEAVKLPVFDFVTMINYVFSALVRKRFEGFI